MKNMFTGSDPVFSIFSVLLETNSTHHVFSYNSFLLARLYYSHYFVKVFCSDFIAPINTLLIMPDIFINISDFYGNISSGQYISACRVIFYIRPIAFASPSQGTLLFSSPFSVCHA